MSDIEHDDLELRVFCPICVYPLMLRESKSALGVTDLSPLPVPPTVHSVPSSPAMVFLEEGVGSIPPRSLVKFHTALSSFTSSGRLEGRCWNQSLALIVG